MSRKIIDDLADKVDRSPANEKSIAYGLLAIAYALVTQSENQLKMQDKAMEQADRLNREMRESEAG